MSSPPPLPNDYRPPSRFPITNILLNVLILTLVALCGFAAGVALVLPVRSELQRTRVDFGICLRTLSESHFQQAYCLDELADCGVHLETLTSTSVTIIRYGSEE